MSIDFIRPEVDELRPRISVIGVGGAGGNAIANMIKSDVQGVDFIVANTDAQALNASSTDRRIQLGLKITQGLGAGSRPEIGRAAAEETLEEIERALDGAHMCFIAAGMGGGTGTGAAPVIAKAARDRGILTVGVVTKPFAFEGTRRGRAADAGIEELQQHVDTLIVIPNQNLFRLANSETTFKEAFEMADEVLQQGVRGITDLMVMPGLINLDFADVRSVMGEMGKAMMGTGEAAGDNRAIEAAEKAISNPLLDGGQHEGRQGRHHLDHRRRGHAPDGGRRGRQPHQGTGRPRRQHHLGLGVQQQYGRPHPRVGRRHRDRSRDRQPWRSRARCSASRPRAPPEPRRTTAAPSLAPAPTATEDSAPLDLDTETDEADELLLDSDDILTSPVGSAPIAPPADDDYDLTEPTAAMAGDDPERPRVARESGTLFERMSNIARGAAKAQVDLDQATGVQREPIDIPRFLNRQNNQ